MTTENQETPNEKLNFPILHDKCPLCGKPKGITETVRDEEAAKGKIPKDCPMVALQAVTPITELKTIILGLSIVPLLTYQLEVCKCGIVYSIRAQRQDIATGELQKMMGIVPQPRQVPPLGFNPLNRQQRRHGT